MFRMKIFFLIFVCMHAVGAVYNEPMDFLIGQNTPSGAILLLEEAEGSVIDLSRDCGKSECPSVIIFASQQWGTIDVKNCKKGRSYTFINKSKVDLGIVVQQAGGRFGSKPIARFDLANCFCLDVSDPPIDETALLCR